jgi:hypothetical protein
MNITANTVEKITSAALSLMAKTASNREPGEKFTPADIANVVYSDPTGETAAYLANLIVTGVQHYTLFREINVQ